MVVNRSMWVGRWEAAGGDTSCLLAVTATRANPEQPRGKEPDSLQSHIMKNQETLLANKINECPSTGSTLLIPLFRAGSRVG